MCVRIEHPFPSINPARTGTGPCGGGPPHTAPSPHSGPPSSRDGEAEQTLNRKSMSASVGIAAGFSRAALASPECAWHHQNTAFTRLTDVSPRWLRRTALSCEFTPPSIMSCRCAWSDRHSRGDKRPSWAPLPKGYLTVPEKVIYLRER